MGRPTKKISAELKVSRSTVASIILIEEMWNNQNSAESWLPRNPVQRWETLPEEQPSLQCSTDLARWMSLLSEGYVITAWSLQSSN